ncbi:unnamed protein product [Microthlaspi erraticum]|uniref:DUF1985 domain-containing protein n=1 Tax=Microthlaspi erraticum TaxID=1685480 RepID=A0A6D2JJ76_9BRAS|nr:unnamed protein product [Microthlaspi erraticum]
MEEGSDVAAEDSRLPTRLMKTDHFPNRRLNCYSKADTIAFVKYTLRDRPEVFQRIRNSRFGKLWDFPAVRCPISCKLIHALLCRQLLSKKHYEMWTVFGGQPLHFSLSEFASITGLHCGEFPENYDPDWYPPVSKGPDRWWREFIGNDSRTTIADIATTLESDEDMDDDRKLRLCLILLVDGVLCVSSQVLNGALESFGRRSVGDVKTKSNQDANQDEEPVCHLSLTKKRVDHIQVKRSVLGLNLGEGKKKGFRESPL